MTSVGVARFKATCLQVLDRVARTGEEITITKRGKAIARVVPSVGNGDRHPQRTLQGTAELVGDIMGPAVPPSAWQVLRGASSGRSARRKS